MVIAATLQSGSKASAHLARFHQQEVLRSVQLYGVTPGALDWSCRCVGMQFALCLKQQQLQRRHVLYVVCVLFAVFAVCPACQ
jgi:hypothetical protein